MTSEARSISFNGENSKNDERLLKLINRYAELVGIPQTATALRSFLLVHLPKEIERLDVSETQSAQAG